MSINLPFKTQALTTLSVIDQEIRMDNINDLVIIAGGETVEESEVLTLTQQPLLAAFKCLVFAEQTIGNIQQINPELKEDFKDKIESISVLLNHLNE